jgi:hypothetical protein
MIGVMGPWLMIKNRSEAGKFENWARGVDMGWDLEMYILIGAMTLLHNWRIGNYLDVAVGRYKSTSLNITRSALEVFFGIRFSEILSLCEFIRSSFP